MVQHFLISKLTRAKADPAQSMLVFPPVKFSFRHIS
jgi:hypothetical protein